MARALRAPRLAAVDRGELRDDDPAPHRGRPERRRNLERHRKRSQPAVWATPAGWPTRRRPIRSNGALCAHDLEPGLLRCGPRRAHRCQPGGGCGPTVTACNPGAGISRLVAGRAARFLESAKHDPHHVAFHLAAATGLRRGELLGLRWCDINEAAGQLHVVQTVVEVAHEARISPPKTERSRRLVALDRKTTELLARRRATTAARTQALDDHSLVFATESGDPIHPALFSYYFQRRVRLAGRASIGFTT